MRIHRGCGSVRGHLSEALTNRIRATETYQDNAEMPAVSLITDDFDVEVLEHCAWSGHVK